MSAAMRRAANPGVSLEEGCGRRVIKYR